MIGARMGVTLVDVVMVCIPIKVMLQGYSLTPNALTWGHNNKLTCVYNRYDTKVYKIL